MKIVFLRSAIADLLEIAAFISRDNPAASIRAVRRIRAAIRRLSQFPYSARSGDEPETRELVVGGLPYIVVYRISEGPVGTFVEITSIFHSARDRTATEARNGS